VAVRFTTCDPEIAPASELLADMVAELNETYDTPGRLDLPKVTPSDLRSPAGVYLVGRDGGEVVAGGGLRALAGDVAELKRMYVRPAARGRGVGGELLRALEEAAQALGYRAVRLDTGPKQVHAQRLYRGAGFVDIASYNDNPFACYWGEKVLKVAER
jgi:GNAT superfamily N-acetyltransferase